MMKRLMALLLAGILIFSLVPAHVLATEEGTKYEVGAILKLADADSVDPNKDETISIPDNTAWIIASQSQENELNCDKEHTHDATCGDCLTPLHTHVWKCPLGCAETHHTEKCCNVVHVHGTDCNCEITVHSHDDSCYENCPGHTCDDSCTPGEDGTCSKTCSHESCTRTCNLDEHTHGDNCCTVVHVHGEGCVYDHEGHPHITEGCGFENQCSTEPHTHGDGNCEYACSKEAHSHGENCYETVTYNTWKLVNVFKVSFYSNGTECLEPQYVPDGQPAEKPDDPERREYEFDVWCQNYGLTNVWDFDTPITKDTTLHARWLAEVTFKYNNGDPDFTRDVIVGSKLVKPEISRENCTLDGWYDSQGNQWFTESSNDKVTSAKLTLSAKWLANVTFNLNYTGSAAPQTETVTADTLLPAPTKPSRDGYVFDGWYKESATTNKWGFTTDKVTRNITLYAKWLEPVTVTFNSNGGSSVPSKIVGNGNTVTRPENPVKSNKLFDNWYKDSGLTTKWNFDSDTVSSNTTLYAKWKNNPLIVSRKNTGNLHPGDTETFIAKYNTTDDVSNKVTWKVERADTGTCASGTKFSGSKLTIDDDEKVGTLKITATSTEYGTDFITVTLYPLYEFKSGSGGKWAQKSTKNLTFECNGPMKEISKDGIMIDSKPVKEENYTLSESTYGFKLVLKPAALKDLTVKKHTLTITFDDGGKAETTFEVVKESDIPETGDALMLPLWVALMGVTTAAALVLLKKRSL